MRPVEYAQILLTCLREELDGGPNPIVSERVCLRFGQEVRPSLGTQTDECCSGLAWVRVVEQDPLNSPDDLGSNNCPITSGRRLILEMGTARCIPFGTVQAPATCDQWTEAALKMDADHAAMEAALCCFGDAVADLPGVDNVFPLIYNPFGPDGNCILGTLQVSLDYDCGCE
jgi:hypothetical protein